MKLFLVVLLAGVWSTVTAAPSPNVTYEEYALDFPENITTIFQKDTVKCIKNVVAQVVVDSEYKPFWDELKKSVDQLLSIEWPKCQSLESSAEKIQCQMTVVKHLVNLLDKFAKKLSSVSAWNLVNAIKNEVLSKCFHSKTDLFGNEELYITSLIVIGDELFALFHCAEKVLDKVSKAHGLQSLWENSQPQLVHHFGKWKECEQIPDTGFQYMCVFKEARAINGIIDEYVKLAAAQDPSFTESFSAEYKQTCG